MRIFKYIFMMTGLILLLEFAGIPTGAEALIDFVGIATSGTGITTSDFWNAIFGSSGILIGLAIGVTIGILTRAPPENFIILPLITGSLGFFASSFVSIMIYSIANYEIWVSSLIVLIFGPLTIGYLLSLVDFFRGTD